MDYPKNPPHGEAPPPDPKDLIDPKLILGWLTLFVRFVRRRIWLPIVAMVIMGGVAVAALSVLPKTYESELTLIAKKSEYLSPDQYGSLTMDADVLLHRRENIADMVKRTNLVHEWKARRPPILRLKDDLYAQVFGATSDKDLALMLAAKLHDSLRVATEGDTLTIIVAWSDPEIAYRLVHAAHKAFLDERHIQEISMLSESLDILEKHSAKLETEIRQQSEKARVLIDEKNKELKQESEKKLEETKEKFNKKVASFAPTVREPVARKPVESAVDKAMIADLDARIEEKKTTLENLTRGSRSTVAELQAKLSQARAIYREAHPVVSDLKQQIAIAQQEPASVVQLRSEIAALESERGALDITSPDGGATPTSTVRRAARARLGADLIDKLDDVQEYDLADPEVSHARAKISLAMRKFEGMQIQIDNARLKLKTAQAAFRYRYRTVTPAEVPNKPVKPQPAKVILGSLVAGLGLGIFIAFLLEARRGLIHEPWQVESVLGLPVVACIESHPQPRRLA